MTSLVRGFNSSNDFSLGCFSGWTSENPMWAHLHFHFIIIVVIFVVIIIIINVGFMS